MNILMAASEMAPYCKTGGLGDVICALPRALAREGARVSVILPLYRAVDRAAYGLKPVGKQLAVGMGSRTESCRILRASLEEAVDVYFVDHPGYFDREELYGPPGQAYPDNDERYIFFSRVVVELATNLRPRPHVIHCHDWQTGIVPSYPANLFRYERSLNNVATVFTIHNIGYQGIFPRQSLELTGLAPDVFTPEGLEFWDRVNLMKAGIVFADALTTVSQGYAREIQTPEFGFGLDGVIRKFQHKLFGIMNGADYELWDPATDCHLPANYSPAKPAGKQRCKRALQEELGLEPDPGLPLLGMVSRLAEQKGVELLIESAERLLGHELQIVVLGVGSERLEHDLRELAVRFPGRFAAVTEFNVRLSHLVEAGADIFLMPSRYEPCGLNQIYSLKYGTIPVVRATGGLDDSVVDVRIDPEAGTGFKFQDYSAGSFAATVEEAVDWFRDRRREWKKLMANAFAQDFGWQVSARRYLEVYHWAFSNKSSDKLGGLDI